jgi:hypothetical protein
VKRVLVLGGYGGFGGRVARLLAEDGFEVLVGGRSLAKAEAFCARHPNLTMRPKAVDRSGDLRACIAAEKIWLVVDAAGPFQGSDYRVAEACIAAGCHYLDLADGRDFVCGFDRLDEAARAAGVTAISGASSVPALSTAVIDRLGVGLDRLTRIDIALSASNRASGGTSVTRAILSYVGKPIALWRGQAWRTGVGWQEMGKVRFDVAGHAPLERSVALCDVPDLALLPGRYPGRPAVRFRAGTELAIHNVGLWLLSWPVRWRWLRGAGFLTAAGVRVQRLLGGIGGDRSAMGVEVSGWADGAPVRRCWTVVAEAGDGPWIPAMAAPLLARRMAAGMSPGARTAAGALALEAFEQAFERFAIATATEESRPAPLYRRIMDDGFERLPPAVREGHQVDGELVLKGEARIARGASLLARLAGRLLRLPPAAESVAVTVWMEEKDGGEIWRRDFGGVGFATRLAKHGPRLVERFGLLRFGMELKSEPDGLSMPMRRWWIGPLPMPIALAPRVLGREREVDGRFHFDVPLALPLAGPLIHYSGWLEPVGIEDAGDSGSKPAARRCPTTGAGA